MPLGVTYRDAKTYPEYSSLWHYFSQIPEKHDIGIYREKIWPRLVCVVNGLIHPRQQFGTLDPKGYLVVRLDKVGERRPAFHKSENKRRVR